MALRLLAIKAVTLFSLRIFMSITYSSSTRVFHLQFCDTSYIIRIERDQYLSNVYWGRRLNDWHGASEAILADRPFEPNPDPEDRSFSLDTLSQEYPCFGNTDFRSPAFQVRQIDGSTITDLKYISHTIKPGKPRLSGLPSVYTEDATESETLTITLQDEKIGLEVALIYTTFRDHNALTRSVVVRNRGNQELTLLRVASANVDFPRSDLDMISLSGSWARERHIVTQTLSPGIQSLESRRGASSHQHNPFVALAQPNTDETHGEVWVMNLVYSGNFLAQAEVDQFGGTRLSVGINPFEFSWLLQPGSEFTSPEAVLIHSSRGLGGMSESFHQLYRNRLCRGQYRDAERPILINNWEATYFDFNTERILALADEAAAVGIELLVLDDGWFGKRNDDRSSLGDWVVDQSKLPAGLADLADQVEKRGLRFGLWFEPEMISVNSRLYKAHPDWCLHVPGRPRSEGRNQLVLDLGRPEVCDYIVESVSTVLKSASISYVKWDMNRHQTEVGSAALPADRQKETSHRYILGLYDVLERITSTFPAVLFESCSGGGGRFDPGILHYMPQTWTSDNTDAVSRLKIQYGTSLIYPPITMGAHVSAVPNHQVNRITPLSFRGDIAMAGNLGYELDLGRLNETEKALVANQVIRYKKLRYLVQFGNFYRLQSPFLGNSAAWQYVSPDGLQIWVCYYQLLAEANQVMPIVNLRGLQQDACYLLEGTTKTFGGDELMFAGIRVTGINGDFQSCSWFLEMVV